MKYIKQIFGVCIALLLGLTLNAQQVATTSGGNASGSGGTANYTVGQVVYSTNTGTDGSVTEGVQQPYEISVVTGIKEAKNIKFSVSAYPNPTTDLLQLKIESKELKGLSFRLYDMQGKLLQNDKITDNQASIVMTNLAPATYFVKVIQNNKEVKTFKIIKTH